ncbi:MAG: glycosyltransferase [Clostridium sp.]|nr:glycosyltransferase [Clostridium sp.]
MKVLWLATSPSLYNEQKVMSWIGALEDVIRSFCPQIELGIAFEYTDSNFKCIRDNVTYYPIDLKLSKTNGLKLKFLHNNNWVFKKPHLSKIIDDFNPDIIQCFGSEWNWGLIASETNVPVVVHMQGFINIITNIEQKVQVYKPSFMYLLLHPRLYLQKKFLKAYNSERNIVEKKIMKSCHYFMGRTEWDKSIVKYFSPNSTYYHCSEAIRPAIYNSLEKWSYKKSDTIKIVTISAAGFIKGNGVILEAAKILKEMGAKIEWRVSGDKEIFSVFEKTVGIRANDVGIKLLGFISADEVKHELLSSEMFVLPSIIDNSPNSLCEAQLIGTPVIASYVGGIPQLVEDGKTGFLFPYNEPYTLAFRILEMHTSPGALMQLSLNERNIAKERHDPKKLADRLIEVYSEIIAQSKKRGALL